MTSPSPRRRLPAVELTALAALWAVCVGCAPGVPVALDDVPWQLTVRHPHFIEGPDGTIGAGVTEGILTSTVEVSLWDDRSGVNCTVAPTAAVTIGGEEAELTAAGGMFMTPLGPSCVGRSFALNTGDSGSDAARALWDEPELEIAVSDESARMSLVIEHLFDDEPVLIRECAGFGSFSVDDGHGTGYTAVDGPCDDLALQR